MHYIGYITYLAVTLSIFFVPAAQTLVLMSYKLATEITVGCLGIAAYPLIQFAYYHVRGLREKVHFERMCSVANTCGNTVVSLGLIGTFVGLTKMIEKIAGAIGGEGGNLDEQIALIMTAIGESLDAMSFAFLTSVMGVAASVTVYFANIYFKMYFDKFDAENEDVVTDEAIIERLQNQEEEIFKLRGYLSRSISANVDRKELASMIVSNTLQVKALTDVCGKLDGSIASQVGTTEGLANFLSDLYEQGNLSAKQNKQILQFLSGSYDELTDMNKAVKSIGSNQDETKYKNNKLLTMFVEMVKKID